MVLPLSLLRGSQNTQILVELKNGQTYNGILVNSDVWMNINLRDVVCTSKDGDRFWKIPECYIRGNTIKYLCMPNEVLNKIPEDLPQIRESKPGRGGKRLRGTGRGGNTSNRGGNNRGRGGKPQTQ